MVGATHRPQTHLFSIDKRSRGYLPFIPNLMEQYICNFCINISKRRTLYFIKQCIVLKMRHTVSAYLFVYCALETIRVKGNSPTPINHVFIATFLSPSLTNTLTCLSLLSPHHTTLIGLVWRVGESVCPILAMFFRQTEGFTLINNYLTKYLFPPS